MELPKLTRQQWHDLDDQWGRTPALADGWMPSGEHWILMALLASMGFKTSSREQAMKVAEELLVQGWQDE